MHLNMMRHAAEEQPKKQLLLRPTEDQSVVSQSAGPAQTGEVKEEMALSEKKVGHFEEAILCKFVVNGRISRGGES